MIRSLRRLQDTATKVAQNRLPELVKQLSESDPQDVDTSVESVGVHSRDEIGQVAAAFDDVHREAVRLAAEQALLRGNVNAMFTNLSRRSQGLIQRQLSLISELESREADPDQLSSLFKLDHLATRMRRNGENLLVLAGEEPGRRWTRPVPLVDVLRAAASEVEQYERIELRLRPDDRGRRPRRQRPRAPARRAAGERHLVLLAADQGQGHRSRAARRPGAGRDPRHRHRPLPRGPRRDQRAAGQPADRGRLGLPPHGPVRGRPPVPAARHPHPAAPLRLRRYDRAGHAARRRRPGRREGPQPPGCRAARARFPRRPGRPRGAPAAGGGRRPRRGGAAGGASRAAAGSARGAPRGQVGPVRPARPALPARDGRRSASGQGGPARQAGGSSAGGRLRRAGPRRAGRLRPAARRRQQTAAAARPRGPATAAGSCRPGGPRAELPGGPCARRTCRCRRVSRSPQTTSGGSEQPPVPRQRPSARRARAGTRTTSTRAAQRSTGRVRPARLHRPAQRQRPTGQFAPPTRRLPATAADGPPGSSHAPDGSGRRPPGRRSHGARSGAPAASRHPALGSRPGGESAAPPESAAPTGLALPAAARSRRRCRRPPAAETAVRRFRHPGVELVPRSRRAAQGRSRRRPQRPAAARSAPGSRRRRPPMPQRTRRAAARGGRGAHAPTTASGATLARLAQRRAGAPGRAGPPARGRRRHHLRSAAPGARAPTWSRAPRSSSPRTRPVRRSRVRPTTCAAG